MRIKCFFILFLFSFPLHSGEVISLKDKKVKKIRERKTRTKIKGDGGQVLYWMKSAFNMNSFLADRAWEMESEELKMNHLHIAVTSNRTDLVTYLLETGEFDIDAKDANGNTALHLAATLNNPEMIRLLIEYGADKNAVRDLDGNRPLHLAALSRHVDNVKELLVARVDVNATNKEGNTALHMVALSDFTEQHLDEQDPEEASIVVESQFEVEEKRFSIRGITVMTELIMSRANVDAKNKYKNTPLHLSVESDDPKILEFLLFDAIADPSIENILEETAEKKAKAEGNYQAVEIFLRYNKALEQGGSRERLSISSQDEISEEKNPSCHY